MLTGRWHGAFIHLPIPGWVKDKVGSLLGAGLKFRYCNSLGFEGVESVRSGRFFQLRLRAETAKKAEKQVDQICSRLLANPVIETYKFEVVEG